MVPQKPLCGLSEGVGRSKLYFHAAVPPLSSLLSVQQEGVLPEQPSGELLQMRDLGWHSDYFGCQKACLGHVEMRCFCQPWEKISCREYALSDFSALLKFYLVFPSLSLISTSPQCLQNPDTGAVFLLFPAMGISSSLCVLLWLCVSQGETLTASRLVVY